MFRYTRLSVTLSVGRKVRVRESRRIESFLILFVPLLRNVLCTHASAHSRIKSSIHALCNLTLTLTLSLSHVFSLSLSLFRSPFRFPHPSITRTVSRRLDPRARLSGVSSSSPVSADCRRHLFLSFLVCTPRPLSNEKKKNRRRITSAR